MLAIDEAQCRKVAEFYFILKWKQSLGYKGWPRYEVRPMNGIETDSRWTVVDQGLTFDEADNRREQLERKETQLWVR